MKYLLNTIYLCFLVVALPCVAILRIVQRKSLRSWPAKFFGSTPLPPNKKNGIWFHAVSVGEVNLLVTIVKRYRHEFPATPICISATTDTGFELAKSKFPDCHVFYFPWDFSWAIKRVIRALNPRCLILTELEIWPNLIGIANARQIPVVVVNARHSKNSFAGYRRFSFFTRPVFNQLQHVAAQNSTYAKRFQKLGVPADRVTVTGSIKFDGASLIRDTQRTLEFRQLADVQENEIVLMAGSTQDGEDAIIIDAFKTAKRSHPHLRLIIAPRHPHRAPQISNLLKSANLNPVRRSEIDSPCKTDDVLIIDTIGELSDWWGVADIAFVGGSLGNRGGQNMIEPAAKGCAVCFGPNTKNFKQVVELFLEKQIATVVYDADDIANFIQISIDSPTKTKTNRQNARELIVQQQGATQKTVSVIATILADRDPAIDDRQTPFAA